MHPEAGPPPLTAEEIRERMSGNLCRCGAYVSIVQAVARAAAADERTARDTQDTQTLKHEETAA
jgi:xanthine dehydrogenase YagT iron-sulfur-binding subunit